MNIVIVGGGLVGSTLAGKFSADGHDVTLVERQSARCRELMEHLDVQVLDGNGATAPVLRRAGVEQADLLVATSNSDEANLAVGLLATSCFNVPRVVVRLRDSAHDEGFKLICRDHTGEHVQVNPEAAAVDRIAALLAVPGAVDVMHFLDGRLLVAGFQISPSSDFGGLTLAHMKLMFPAAPTLVVAIQRGNQWLIPHGEEEMKVGDLIYFAIVREDLDNVLSLIGVQHDPQRHVMVAGAGWIGLELARRLEQQDTKVVLLEGSPELARRAEEALNRTLVICGQVTDRTVLEEEDIDRVSTFIAVTPDHEVNLVSSLLAKRLGAHRAFALVDNPALANLIGDIGIDAVISPRLLAVGLILQHAIRGRVRSVAALLGEKVEVIEAEAMEGSRLTLGSLSEIDLPPGMLVAALRRGEQLLLPKGPDRVEPGDQVLIITTMERAAELDAYLSAG